MLYGCDHQSEHETLWDTPAPTSLHKCSELTTPTTNNASRVYTATLKVVELL
jgi:hypothetical protein